MNLELDSKPAGEKANAAAPRSSHEGTYALPDDALIILPVRRMVLFPGMILPVALGREASIAAAQAAAKAKRPVGVLLQRNPEAEKPGPEELSLVGTVASIVRYVTTPDGTHHVICQGQQRFRVVEYLEGYPFLVARVGRIEEPEAAGNEIEARFVQLKERALEVLGLLPQAPRELVAAIQAVSSPGSLADLVAGVMDIEVAEKQALLETVDLQKRMDSVLELLAHRLQVLKLSREIDERTKASLDDTQRKYLLREQMKSIQKELGEGEEGQAAELEELKKAIAEAGMPEEVEKQAMKELKRLERMSDASGEYSMVRTYLDWLIELPWKSPEPDAIDMAEARRILDADHFGLDQVKKRIVEFLAVRKLNPEGHGPILCFVGPPGVGKTSLGQSVAKALGRKFVRVSLGGVHDEAEIRGHRRTYIGALPGNIIQAIKKAGARNCVMMLDEIDKLGRGIQGDPSAAMLEVLDPEQNSTFRDNYLGVPFDLSRVVFIATANMLDTIPGPLQDRMEIIGLPGYTEDEKLEIGRRYLVRRQLEANGLNPEQAEIEVEALRLIIRGYTREAGARSLEREIGRAFRHAAVQIAEGSSNKVTINASDLTAVLGPPRFENEIAMRTSIPGVATGLAWTPVGGDILFIEATRIPGKGALILTGQLGEVMKESAQAALSLVKGKAAGLGLDTKLFDNSDIHIHIPAGAIPKDGPSAGVAMFTALVSLLTGRTVKSDTAMTGEISLRGLVLPVGGIKEKIVAAARAGLGTVILPARNRRDYEEIPEAARNALHFIWAERVEEVIEAALEPAVASALEPAAN